MAGPSLDMIASVRKGSNKEHVLETISQTVSRHGFGVLRGVDSIRRLYDREGELLDQLSREFENPLVISITDNPRATDAWNTFQRDLHPSFANPEKAAILKLLAAQWSIGEIQAAFFVILRVDTEFLPRYEIGFEEFLESVAHFQEKEQHTNVERGGGMGIFKVTKDHTG